MILLYVFSTFVLSAVGLDSNLFENSDAVIVTVTDIVTNGEPRVSHVLLPEKFRMTIHKQHSNESIVLERNTNLQSNVPMVIERHGKIIYQDLNDTEIVGFYHSMDPFASIMTTTDKNSEHSSLKLMGDVKLHNDTFRLHFNHESQGYTLSKLKIMFNERNSLKTVLDRDFIKTDRHLASGNRQEESTENISAEFQSFVNDGERINKALYEIEVMAVADYSEYMFWLSSVSKAYPELPFIFRDSIAKQRLIQYTAFVLNGVDLRYRSITTRNYNIRILLTAVYCADTRISSSWTELSKYQHTDPDYIDSDAVLSKFTDWYETFKEFLPGHDHAMLFTKYDIAQTKDGILDKDVVGVANQGDICFLKKQSLIQDTFGEDVALAAAHEIGHNLGADHDGKLGFCLAEEEYIMSPVITHSKPQLRNHWKFSACSQYYFFRNINNLNKLGLNCMSSRENNVNLLSQYTNKLPGQIYSPDQQCEYRYGKGSYLYRYGYQENYTNICSTLRCTDPVKTGYHYITDTMEGTTCGNEKICRSGYCVEEEGSKTGLKEICLFGDGPETYHGSHTTCSSILEGSFFDAYYRCHNYKLTCCETCSNLYLNHGMPIPQPENNVGSQPAVGECVRSCQGVQNGNYQSCRGCHMYVSCYDNVMYDGRPCQANLYWSDDLKRCEYSSNTC
ncbi:zinc metalloproteinase-disintegrin-like VMP-III [Ruditapes philippinarum]|uniref:zinc metalloproteinase-disintegrin-like VMP-III n=1 Tax=Ruditapes philippinarum TaxID=129788 RepID=UPI00295A8BA3|nr:zinc metalloproteinase-disintegrin-like VMP-III [Ruditapes philippinarum]